MTYDKKWDVVIACWADPASGPGWSNTPVRCIFRRGNGEYDEQWFQPEEQSERMRTIYKFSAEANYQMVREAEKLLGK